MHKDGYDAACSILETGEANALEAYSKGINHLFNLSRYHRYHGTLKRDARVERFVIPTSAGRRSNSEMRPLLQHMF